MDAFFVEKEEGDIYRIACIDKLKIFLAEDPSKLAVSFDSSLSHPSQEDRAQIFFALAPTIGALDFQKDLIDSCWGYNLNVWTLFGYPKTLTPLTREYRILLYSKSYSITPTEGELAQYSHSSLPYNAQLWKTGILQRCFSCLLLPEHKTSPRMYTLLDEQYRRIIRFKIETEGKEVDELTLTIRDISFLLGLKHSRDTTPFEEIPVEVYDLCLKFDKIIGETNKVCPTRIPNGYSSEGARKLGDIFFSWIGSILVEEDGIYHLEINPDITEVLQCMVPIMDPPSKSKIIGTTF